VTSLLVLLLLSSSAVAALQPRAFLYYLAIIGPAPVSFALEDPTVTTPLGDINLSALKVLCLLIGCSLAILLSRAPLTRSLRQFSGFAAFFAFATVSLAWGSDLAMGVRMLLKLVTPIVFALYFYHAVQILGANAVMRAVLLSGTVYVCVAIAWTAVDGGPYLNTPGSSRAVFSGHLLTVVAVALAMVAVRPGLGRFSVAGVFAAAILAAFTRITIGGLFATAGAVYFLHLRGPMRWLVPFLGLGAFVLLFVMVDSFRERMFLEDADNIDIATVVDDPAGVISEIGGSGRFAAWELALERLFEPSPVIGSGIGASQALFYGLNPNQTTVVHSEVVRLLCDLGLLGLGLYLLAWLQITVRLLRGLGSVDENRAIRLAALGSLTGYLLFLLTDNGFDYVGQLGVFVFALAGAASGARATGREGEVGSGPRDSRPSDPLPTCFVPAAAGDPQ